MVRDRLYARLTLLAAGIVISTALEATAQPLGAFRWQLLPYCNVLTLNVTAQGTVFTLDGYDDQCGAAQRASVVGTAFVNPDGTVGMGLNTVVAAGSGFVHIDARMGLASLGGTWRDSAGNSGPFVLTPGGGIGGAPRPAPSHTITRVFTADQITWTLEDIGGFKFRTAVLSVPEITQAIFDRGHVSGFAGENGMWIALPHTITDAVGAFSFVSSIAPGQFVVRLSKIGNVDPGLVTLALKVVIIP